MKITFNQAEKDALDKVIRATFKVFGEKPTTLGRTITNAGGVYDMSNCEFHPSRVVVFLEGVEETINVFGGATKQLMGCWEMLDRAMKCLNEKYRRKFSELTDHGNS